MNKKRRKNSTNVYARQNKKQSKRIFVKRKKQEINLRRILMKMASWLVFKVEAPLKTVLNKMCLKIHKMKLFLVRIFVKNYSLVRKFEQKRKMLNITKN